MSELASELLDELVSDPEVGEMVEPGFEVGRYASRILEMESDEIKKRLDKIERSLERIGPAMDAHGKESQEALIQGAKKSNVLRRDAEAVEVGARDLRRRSKALARKMQEPYEQCSWRVSRLKSIYEANQLIRRCQRALFLFRRLEEKDVKTGDMHEVAKAGALLKEIDQVVNASPSLLRIDALRGRAEEAKNARLFVEAAATKALDKGLRNLKQIEVDAALRAAMELGAADQILEKALDRLGNEATVSANTLFEQYSAQNFFPSSENVSHTNSKHQSAAPGQLADNWATAIEASVNQARLLDKILRAKHFAQLASHKQSVSGRVWHQAAKAVTMCLRDALAPPQEASFGLTSLDSTRQTTILENAQEDNTMNIEAPAPEESLRQNLTKRLEAEVKAAARKVLDETSVRGQALVQKSKRLVEQSKKTLLGTNLSSTPAAKAALSLAASYPVVRRCFVLMTRRVRAMSGRDETALGHTTAFPPKKNNCRPLKNKNVWKRLEKFPLRAAARHAPAKSLVALCEAQFLEIMAQGRKKRYQANWDINLDSILDRACKQEERLPPEEAGFSQEYMQYLANLEAAVTKYRGSDVFECIMLPDEEENEDDSDEDEEHADDEFQPAKASTSTHVPEESTHAKLSSSKISIMVKALDPLREQYADIVRARILEPVLLMFPADHEGYEAMVPSRHDATRLAKTARAELKSALDGSGDAALAPLVLNQTAEAIDEFARRAAAFLAEYEKKTMRRTTGFASLSAAIDTSNEWRASAGEEREAQVATLCASLRSLLVQQLRELVLNMDEYSATNNIFLSVLNPALASLDRVSEGVAVRALDALAYRIESEFADPLHSNKRSISNQAESEACFRAKRALELGRRGYIALLPSWRCDKFDSPATRCALTALAARLARSAVSHAALRGAVGTEESRLSAAADAAALDDTLSAYDISNEADEPNITFRYLGLPSTARVELQNARRELVALKRLLFIEAASSPIAFLNSAREFVADGSLRPSVAWHALLAAAQFSPLPFELAESERGGGSTASYISWLVAGPEETSFVDFDPTSTIDMDQPSDHPLSRLDREADAWRDVQRCLAAFADNAAQRGEASLGAVYDAIHNHGSSLLNVYKNVVIHQHQDKHG